MPVLIRKQAEERAFRVYLTDCLRVLAMGKQYSGAIDRWADITRENQTNQPAQDNRTGEEIAADVIRRAGLVVVS